MQGYVLSHQVLKRDIHNSLCQNGRRLVPLHPFALSRVWLLRSRNLPTRVQNQRYRRR